MQAIRTRYYGPTDKQGACFRAKAEAGTVRVPYDYALNADRNHEQAALAYALKMGWVKDQAEFRKTYVAGWFGNDCYFVDKKGGSLREIRRVEFEVQGRYFGKWETVATSDTMKEARQTLRDYNVNELEFEHRIKRVRVTEGKGE